MHRAPRGAVSRDRTWRSGGRLEASVRVRARPAASTKRGTPQVRPTRCKVGKVGPRADPLQPSTVLDYESCETGDDEDATKPPDKFLLSLFGGMSAPSAGAARHSRRMSP